MSFPTPGQLPQFPLANAYAVGTCAKYCTDQINPGCKCIAYGSKDASRHVCEGLPNIGCTPGESNPQCGSAKCILAKGYCAANGSRGCFKDSDCGVCSDTTMQCLTSEYMNLSDDPTSSSVQRAVASKCPSCSDSSSPAFSLSLCWVGVVLGVIAIIICIVVGLGYRKSGEEFLISELSPLSMISDLSPLTF